MCKTVNKSMIFGHPKTLQKRPQAKKPIFLGLESEKSENLVQNFEIFEKYIKDAPKKTVQNGSYTSPNELMRFPNEAKTLWVEIQTHCKNAVIKKIWFFFEMFKIWNLIFRFF